MPSNLLPFNIDLLLLHAEDIKGLKPVKVLDIFMGGTRNLHPDGLFSVEIFGKAGEEKRNRLFSYIDLRIPILHPVIYYALVELKSLYGEILAGTSYAIFDEASKDFVKADIVTGKTGYSFFISRLNDLVFEERGAGKREFNVKLVYKYRDKCLFDKLVVMPAGLRDYVIDDNGKPSEDEINTLYRKVLSVSGMADNVNIKNNGQYLDNTRQNLQMSVCAIYDYIKNLLEGKSKLIQGKWASRKVVNSTRNVITPYIANVETLYGKGTLRANQAAVGLYQFMRAILPLAINLVRSSYLMEVFTGPNTPAVLVNKKTLKKEMVQINPDYYDKWMTFEGLEKVMATFGVEAIRHDQLEVNDHYLGLIYKGPDGTFRFLQDIDEVPEGRDKKDVTPITYAELLYISVYKKAGDIPGFITRYPVTWFGSVFPAYTLLKTTVNSDTRTELDANWEPTGDIAQEFPRVGEPFYNTLSPHSGHTARLDADFDGDTCSYTAVLTDEAQEEVKKLLRSKAYYLTIDGTMSFSASDDVVQLVFANMTGD